MIPILLTLPFALLPALVSADCSSFTPDTHYTALANQTFALSNGQTCNGTKMCWYTSLNADPSVNASQYDVYHIRTGGLVTYNSTIDYITDPTNKTTLSRLIAHTTDFEPASITTNETGGYGFGVPAGSSGYVGFTAQMTCYNGTVSGCSGEEFPTDATVITACTPNGSSEPTSQCSTPGGYGCLQGTIEWVTTDKATADGTSGAFTHEQQSSAVVVRGANAAMIIAVAGLVIAFMA